MKDWAIEPMIEQFKGIWQRRELFYFLTTANIKAENKNKVLGQLWSLLDPLLLLGTYIILVSVIFDRGGPQFPVLLFCALLAWRWFINSLNHSVISISSKSALVKTIDFPLAILPLSGIAIGFIGYLFGLVILIPMLFVFNATITINILWLPVLLFIQLLITIGLSLIMAVLGTHLSDLRNIIQFILKLWFYLSPILYMASDAIPARYLPFYMLNPFAALLESYKNIFINGLPPSPYVGITAAIAVVLFLAGSWYFARQEKHLVKAI